MRLFALLGVFCSNKSIYKFPEELLNGVHLACTDKKFYCTRYATNPSALVVRELWEDARTVNWSAQRHFVLIIRVTTTLPLSIEAVNAAGLRGSWSLQEGLQNVWRGDSAWTVGTVMVGYNVPWQGRKDMGNQVMSPKKIVFSWIVSQLNSSSYDIWSSTHSSVRVRNQEQRSIRDIFFKGLVMDKKLGNTWLSFPS